MGSMFSPQAYAIMSVVAVGLLPLMAGGVLLVKKKTDEFVFVTVSLSVGALFGDAFIHLIPEAFRGSDSLRPSFWLLFGIVFLFVLEKFLNWHHEHAHRHDAQCAHAVLPLGPLSLVASGMHNFIDGGIIAASYLVSVPVGIATTVAVVLHEIPHELGDLGILVHAGFSKRKALLYNFYSGLIAIAGAGAVLAAGASAQGMTSIIVPFAAGNFIYIAGSDLVPELHKTKHAGHSLVQLAAITAGIGLMTLLLLAE